VATDDAVTNSGDNAYLLMATGKWSAMNNPMDEWNRSFAAIQYLNILLEQADNVDWANTGIYTEEMFNDRIKGETYALRGLFMFYLLQAHAGYTASGELLGVPIYTESLKANSNFSQPRATFDECIQQILSDYDKAESYLPLDYEDVSNLSEIPGKYAGLTTVSDYNRVFGAYNHQRVSSRIVKGLRAQVALLAASPAFNEGSSITWEMAANYAGEVLNLIGGVSGMDSTGGYWYSRENKDAINALVLGSNPPEMLWRGNKSDNSDLEDLIYPPSLYGDGIINPTQNLVDAFPMANGLPISAAGSGYDPNNPYNNRDPRLNLYIVVNGSKMGPSNTTIYTEIGRTTDGLDNIATSTRTGYYLRKLLREDVNLNPTSKTTQNHYVPRIRYTEMFLAYAEAANEAWGPDGSGSQGYSARNVIAALRQRAGIEQPDGYLASISSKEDMRALIRNERRVELCFEGFRFWDLRRWKENIKEPAKAMFISTTEFKIETIENRQYEDYMYYGPLPYSEVLNWGFKQNAGW
jgi:hypothetical protein